MRTCVRFASLIPGVVFFAAISFFPASLSRAAENRIVITVVNPLDIKRPNETIVLSWKDIVVLLPSVKPEAIAVTDEATKENLVTQAVDADGSKGIDDFLFQADFLPNETKRFILALAPAAASPKASAVSTSSTRSTSSTAASKPASKVFARFAPDRHDDFAWENDRIAFRLYGLARQRLAGQGNEEGVVSCGVDVWAKRTRSLIVSKWLSRGGNSYDSGEGLDFYSAANGLGCGGSGVWAAGKLWHARNFTKQRIIANGPIRTLFEVSYPRYDAGGTTVTETRRISLDAGSNLNRFEVTFDSVPPTSGPLTCLLGVNRHRGMESATNPSKGWLATWESQLGSREAFLGCGIVINPATLMRFGEDYRHQYMLAKAELGKPVVYYAGAGWTRSGDFEDFEPWKTYLNQFAQRQLAPVKIKMDKE